MKTTLKRKDAANFIQETLLLIARLEEGEYSKNTPVEIANRFRTIASSHGLEVPHTCPGDAHSNPHVDNCGICMPNWGWVAKDLKIT